MPTCFSERVLWIGIGMLPMCRGWHGTMQIGGGLSHLKTPKSQVTLIESSKIGVPTCFLIRV